MSKHTAGPWEADTSEFPARIVGPSSLLAKVYGDEDARLIAAAPDLLAALQDLVTNCLDNCYGFDGHGGYNRQIQAAKDAIAKATNDPRR